MKTFKELIEKKLTPAELKKREEIAKAMERENPGMDMAKKMRIATAAAKRVAEDIEEQTAEAPSLQKHRIGVRVTNPNNKREVKYVVVTHSDNKKGAQAVGEKHFKKKGYAVHGSFHSGMVSEEVELDEAASVSVTVQATAPADKKYAVTEIHPRTSPRGRTKWKDVSYHSSAEEAKTAADAHAKKNNLHRMKSIVAEELDEAVDFHAQATEHKKMSDAAMDKNDMEAYHHHMSEHHESMGQWHESKGRSSAAEREYDKAEKHHELSISKAKQKNEGIEMLSFKYFQVALEEAKKKMKESELENAHDKENKHKDDEEIEEARTETKDASGKVTGFRDEGDWKKTDKKDGRGKVANLSDKARREAEKLKEEVEEIDEGSDSFQSHLNKAKAAKAAGETGEYHKHMERYYNNHAQSAKFDRSHAGGANGYAANLKKARDHGNKAAMHGVTEEVELDEISTATMSHQGKTTLKHVKNPGVGLRMAAHDIKPGVKGYRDRIALLKAADAEKKLKEEVEEIEEADNLALRGLHTANPQSIPGYMRSTEKGKKSLADKNKPVLKDLIKRQLGRHPKPNLPEEVEIEEASPFDWKAYGKEKAKSATTSGTTKTYHDVKKTSSGTVYTKQSTPDGISKGSGEDAAKAEEPVVKRGRGRPPGVGAKAGGYKPRDPAKKAASAAKAAASKAANRAMRKESFDEEFMGSLIEGFEDEDFQDFLQCEEFDELDEATREALLNFINEKSCGSYKMKESLTGKQHKLDKNKNGKLDSHDFKLLRKEETEQIQESVSQYAAFLTKKN